MDVEKNINNRKSKFGLLIAIIAAIVLIIWLILFFDRQDEGKNKSGQLIKQITEIPAPSTVGDIGFRNYITLKT